MSENTPFLDQPLSKSDDLFPQQTPNRRRPIAYLIPALTFLLGLLTAVLGLFALYTFNFAVLGTNPSTTLSNPTDTTLAQNLENTIPAIPQATPQNRPFPVSTPGTDPQTGLPLSWTNGDCGSTPESARALNCIYSIVLHAWLPPACLTDADHEDADLMYEGRAWSFTTTAIGGGDNGRNDENNGNYEQRNLTRTDLEKGDYHHFTTSFAWHVAHCMYVWKRMHRAMVNGSAQIDSYTANYAHTSHCVKMIGGNGMEGMRDAGTKIFVKYPKCA